MPNSELASLTEKGKLGHIDAFVSHSWHDNPQIKWRVLQEWRAEFKRTHEGREPKLWIDKYCVDQNNIDESLACLPVYLAGCKQLLVLCGTTYLKRLWCLIEVVVYAELGASSANLQVLLLEDSQEEAPVAKSWS